MTLPPDRMTNTSTMRVDWWILAAVVAAQALFVGSTFGSQTECVLLIVTLALTSQLPSLRSGLWPGSEQCSEQSLADRPSDSQPLPGTGPHACSPSPWVTLLWWVGTVVAGAFRVAFRDAAIDASLVLDAVAHGVLAGEFAIVALTLRGRTALMPMIAVTMIATVLAGNGLSETEQVLIGFATATLLALANWVVGRPLAPRSGTRHLQATKTPRQVGTRGGAALLSGLVLAGVLVVTTVLADSVAGTLEWLETRYDPQLLQAVAETDLGGRSQPKYVSRATLNSISDQLNLLPRSIALRVVADRPAGYLRSRVFDTYSEGEWFSTALPTGTEGQALRVLPRVDPALVPFSVRGKPLLQLRPFGKMSNDRNTASPTAATVVAERAKSFNIFTIENDPRRGNHIFLAVDTVLLEAGSSAVRANYQDVIVRGLNERRPYVAYMARKPSPVTLSAAEREVYLQAPEGSEAIAANIATQIFQAGDTSRQRGAAVQRFFHTNFQYSLKPTTRPRQADPIDYLLRVRHAAHCEYFASAAIAVLRAGEVPCRYVSGYVVTEYNDETQHWLARNKDAHAWVEAFDQESGEWFIVEATPGRRYVDQRFNRLDVASQNSQAAGDNPLIDPRSLLSRLWDATSGWVGPFDLVAVARWVRLPLLTFLLSFGVWRYFTATARGTGLDDRYRQPLRKIDRQLRKRGWVRGPSETLHQFAARIRASHPTPHPEWLVEVADWYVRAANERCQGQPPPKLPPFYL